MGGAEGTKLDLDFMDMERVSRQQNQELSWKYRNLKYLKFEIFNNILPFRKPT